MAAYWALALVLLAAVVSNAIGSRIVGGEPTTIEQYPSIVQVESRSVWTGTWGHSCAASILTSYYLLTAAHCFDGILYELQNRRIRAGSSYRTTGGVVHTFESRVNHPEYGANGYDADICVAKLLSALTFNPVIQPVVIINQKDPHDPTPVLPDNVPVVHAGWGTTSAGGSLSSVLQDVTIYTVNNELCKKRYAAWSSSAVVTENMICAGILDVGGKDACQGDSGGPMHFIQPDGTSLLVGIVSWGVGCAHPEYPGVSTSVGSYTNWILGHAV